ncbi:TetR/AcrR family transcriptional regulator [Streptantibioticus cattleyicolor]|uniref:TetR/AcrR family transcriptional regulator n=1 Tax=Streptantibioticus cattleyicolor TaxID=29303 RepID=UPI001E34A453|nr:TetR/AcrR family transcriptional regulator [Streptantibioticus cattleyicolor]
MNESALALFVEQGFHATSIHDIVSRAGLTRGAFYSNYQDKEELFLALYDQQADQLLADLREAAGRLRPGRELPSHLLRHLAGRKRADQRWFLLSMEFTLHAARHPEVARQLAEHEARLIGGLAELIDDALAKAGHAARVRPRELARLMVILHEGATAMRLTEEAHGTPEEFPEELIHHILDALFRPADDAG